MTDKAVSSLVSLDADLWKRNRSVHLPSKGAMRPWACRDMDSPLLAILPDQRQARDFADDAMALGVFKSAEILPELTFDEDKYKFEALKVRRGDVMSRFGSSCPVLAATPASLLAPFAVGGDSFELECGRESGRNRLVEWLGQKGYERSDLVWTPGQFAVRGSIVDIFSPSDQFPIRIEFFDEETESIRFFMPDTQKSLRILRRCSIQSLVSHGESTLEHLIPKNMKIVFFDPKGLDTTAENSLWLWNTLTSEQRSAVPWKKWEELVSWFTAFPRLRVTQEVWNTSARLAIRPFPVFRGRLTDMEMYCANLTKEGYSMEIFSDAPRSMEWAAARGFRAVKGILSEGFIDTVEHRAVISDLELAGVTVSRRSTEFRAPGDWGAGLIKGQWVVHDDYGVAQYIGPQSVKTPDGEQEYLVLQFEGSQRLLIPVMQFYKISSWSPDPGQEPVADSLRSSHWKKSSEKARELAEKNAKDLAHIYAERELTHGYAFSSHPELMRELEGSFTYVETADQIKAIDAVDADMSKDVPMDRLLVGDVGFGKTEVALRAAGKAVFCGKQVALMAPTTLLAQQHYETFTARFADIPVRVEVISRFVSMTRQKKILADLKEGKVDILIGTHRLLSKDVAFKDLGLVIVDEEHRFGVMHKEQLKRLTPGVDMLMLSATPIPRSLSLSISGLRDLSVLETPPQRRLPVITIVRPWSEALLMSAVLREKNRGGQVFFVHNRINDIQERATMLKRLFPKLTIAVAHSGTPEQELESTMVKFEAGGIDILVSTTIVESGLDIPMANTLVVDDAQELGLAQMYQLRGRVGRREEQAYAFLFYPADAHLSVEASERLEAIADLDELGAGYQLARRDLQIRGGGDLIGIAQHGHTTRVGYQKYCDMLSEEISKIKGTYRKQADVEVAFPAAIPGSYLPQENLRVTLYRRMLKVESPEEALELRNETVDRFGRMPSSLKFLMALSYARAAAPDLGITRILCGRDETVISANPDGEWRRIKLPIPWMRRADGFIGPGGYSGMQTLFGAMEKTISALSGTIDNADANGGK